MRAGRLRTRVTIQDSTETRDEVGEVDLTWTPVASRYARVEQTGGAENLRGRQLASVVTDVLTIRHTPGVVPKMRVLVPPDRTLDIVYVADEDGRAREMILDCTEVL